MPLCVRGTRKPECLDLRTTLKLMKPRRSRKEFHDFIFQQIVDGKFFFSHNAFEAFMSYAAARGFTDEQILTMAESRMSSAEILATVEADESIRQPRS
jgi:hypothetical protein